jgi:cytochrome c oxidase assembly factor CtaG
VTGAALLHPTSELEVGWTWDPLPLAVIAAASTFYALGVTRLWRSAGVGQGIRRWQAASFGLALLTLGLALLSPLDGWSDRLFSAHMTQHELLMVVAAPLGVLGRPLLAYAWALPRSRRAALLGWVRAPAPRFVWQFLSAPLFVLVLHALVRWLWHIPYFFESAMRHEALHAVQHLSFFASAALFWWALVHGRYGKVGYGLAVLFVFATALHTSVLGALLSVAPRLAYGIYESRARAAGWSPLEDQELAGLIMWVPSGVLLSLTGLSLFAAWLGEAERRATRAESGPTPGHSELANLESR